jgi:hypothetical protein
VAGTRRRGGGRRVSDGERWGRSAQHAKAWRRATRERWRKAGEKRAAREGVAAGVVAAKGPQHAPFPSVSAGRGSRRVAATSGGRRDENGRRGVARKRPRRGAGSPQAALLRDRHPPPRHARERSCGGARACSRCSVTAEPQTKPSGGARASERPKARTDSAAVLQVRRGKPADDFGRAAARSLRRLRRYNPMSLAM